MRPIGWPETSLTIYQSTLCKIPEEWISEIFWHFLVSEDPYSAWNLCFANTYILKFGRRKLSCAQSLLRCFSWCNTNTEAIWGIIGMSHAVRLTIDPQNSTTEVSSGVESGTDAAVDPGVLFTCRIADRLRVGFTRIKLMCSERSWRRWLWTLSCYGWLRRLAW